MICTHTPPGADGCPCEDCLAARIQMTAEMAGRDRMVMPLWVRQRRFRIHLASLEMLRKPSLSA
jgi:hypothetical protein